MKHTAWIAVLSGAAFVSSPSVTSAQPVAETAESTDLAVAVSADTTVASTYIFRGIPQYRTKSDPASQSTFGVRIDNFGPGSASVSVWNSTALEGYSEHGGTELEFDLTVGYDMALTDKLSIGAGYIAYLYPNADPVDAAHELYVASALANDIATPSVEVYFEFVRLVGVYTALGLSRDFSRGDVTVTPSVTAGLARYRGDSLHLNDVTMQVALGWAATDRVTVGATAAYSLIGRPGPDATFADRSAPLAALTLSLAL